MTFRSIYSAKINNQQLRSIFISGAGRKTWSCSKCNSGNLVWLSDRKHRCRDCWSIGSLTSNTALENSKLPLRIWHELTWCFSLSHSALKASKLIHLNYKSALGIYQTIRQVIVQHSRANKTAFTGTVEVDESYYGGAFKNLRKKKRQQLRKQGLAKRGRGAKFRKQPVFGIYKRNGHVYLELITDCTKAELEEIIEREINKDTEIFSDTFKGYKGLVGLGYVHDTVNHGMEIYVDGRVHINGMEGFWGLSKTNMHTYKGIRKINWLCYLKEMEFRYNNRSLDFEKLVAKIIKLLMSYN